MCQICLWPKTCRTKNIPISLSCVLFTAHQMLAFSQTLLNTSQQNKHWQCTCLQNMTPHFFMLHFYVVMTAALNSGPVSWNHVNNHQWFHDLSVSRPAEGKLTGLSAAGRRPDIILKTSNGSTLTNPSSLPSSSWKSKNIWFCCHQHDSSGFSPVHHHSLHLLTWSSARTRVMMNMMTSIVRMSIWYVGHFERTRGFAETWSANMLFWGRSSMSSSRAC